ncbi:hypothetical protein DMENIID0001_093640 [Sergentomyia squamirostris]
MDVLTGSDKCKFFTLVCENLECPYGKETRYNSDSCPICFCKNPCITMNCPPDSKCVIEVNENDSGTQFFMCFCKKLINSNEALKQEKFPKNPSSDTTTTSMVPIRTEKIERPTTEITETNLCVYSSHGCCPDQKTPATGPNNEGCVGAVQRACGLWRDKGPCQNFIQKFHFDVASSSCKRFRYGGCEGNLNRFDSREECLKACAEPIGREACFLPKIRGLCTQNLKRWFYDIEQGQCMEFTWSGCLGNNNRFESLEDCQDACN